MKEMTTKNLDITGKVCPYCVLAIQKSVTGLKSNDELVVTCDHPSAATSSIPQFAEDAGLACESKKISPGLWELRLTRK
ncbi:MAG: sulfurtransferase TusA family protein [Methanoregulaceae archaeon]|nr:MAG: sulfurtransferase TusA family protein [Methanoregulaceae archaeon]